MTIFTLILIMNILFCVAYTSRAVGESIGEVMEKADKKTGTEFLTNITFHVLWMISLLLTANFAIDQVFYLERKDKEALELPEKGGRWY